MEKHGSGERAMVTDGAVDSHPAAGNLRRNARQPSVRMGTGVERGGKEKLERKVEKLRSEEQTESTLSGERIQAVSEMEYGAEGVRAYDDKVGARWEHEGAGSIDEMHMGSATGKSDNRTGLYSGRGFTDVLTNIQGRAVFVARKTGMGSRL